MADEQLHTWVEDGAGEQPLGLLLTGRSRPLRGESIEYREVYDVWVITAKDGNRLVVRSSSVAAIELPPPKPSEG